MRLYIVRHGKAEVDAPTGLDKDRRLKAKGHRQAVFVGQHVASSDRPPLLILASGLMRAQQTAHDIADQLRCEISHEPTLEPDHTASSVIGIIQSHAALGSLMLVGHNPQCVDVLSVLSRTLGPTDSILRTGEAIVMDIRLSQPIGSGRIVERIRLDEHQPAKC